MKIKIAHNINNTNHGIPKPVLVIIIFLIDNIGISLDILGGGMCLLLLKLALFNKSVILSDSAI